MQFNLRTEKCPCCGKEMMDKDKGNLFPFCFTETQEAQMKKLNVVFRSSSIKDGEPICVECEFDRDIHAARNVKLFGSTKRAECLEQASADSYASAALKA